MEQNKRLKLKQKIALSMVARGNGDAIDTVTRVELLRMNHIKLIDGKYTITEQGRAKL